MWGSWVVVVLLAQSAATSPAPRPLTLAEAVTAARRASPSSRAAAVLAAGADAAWRAAGRLPNPVVDVRGENLAARGTSPTDLPADLFAVITQPVEWPGKRRERQRVAGAERDVAALGLSDTERQVALQTVRAYMRALSAREWLATITEHRAGLSAIIDSLTRRVAEGVTAEADLLRFRTEAAALAAEAARVRLELVRSLAELGALTAASGALDAAQLVEPPPALPPPTFGDDQILSAIERRSDIRLASAHQDRAARVARLERLRLRPDPAITAGYKRTSLFDTGVLGVTLALPLFDRNRSAIARAEADAEAAAVHLDGLRLRALAEARALLDAAVTLAAQAAQAGSTLLEPAALVRDAARSTFREGVADILKMVDAERVYANVRREALAIRLDAYVAVVEARFAIGLEDIP